MAPLIFSSLINIFLLYSCGIVFYKISKDYLTKMLLLGFVTAGSIQLIMSLFFPINIKVLAGTVLLE